MAVGDDELTKVNVADLSGARAVPELFTHITELPSGLLPQPREFPSVPGSDGRLLPESVQPYQKLFRSVVPLLNNVIV